MSIKEGFYKVCQSGGTYVTATFFNPCTLEEYTQCVRDYDYSDCSPCKKTLFPVLCFAQINNGTTMPLVQDMNYFIT